MMRETYWEDFTVSDEDIELIYNHLLETETPLTTADLAKVLVQGRIDKELQKLEQQRSGSAAIYMPKERYEIGQSLLFPALGWQKGEVVSKRPANNPLVPPFEVIRVRMEDGREREFASGLEEHILNQPIRFDEGDPLLQLENVLATYGNTIAERLEEALNKSEEFVRIAGKWFPRALLVDVGIGNLNIAEAVLDMNGGGPMSTPEILAHLELPADSEKLVEFSLDYALQEDERFDEVGPAGKVMWFLRRLEPEEVLEKPEVLRYRPLEYNENALTDEMRKLEAELEDELSPQPPSEPVDEVSLALIYPHWAAGTLPLSAAMASLFPTAYEAPRVRFTFIDGISGNEFPGWVVRPGKYVYGLADWYRRYGLQPGSIVTVKRGEKAGTVIVSAKTHRPTRDWVRTVMVGRDGKPVFAMLRQSITAEFDEHMIVAVPDVKAVNEARKQIASQRMPFEELVVSTLRELAKLNPQGHVHATELYSALNVLRRCPPGPIFALLATRPWFVPVGDLYYRLDESAF